MTHALSSAALPQRPQQQQFSGLGDAIANGAFWINKRLTGNGQGNQMSLFVQDTCLNLGPKLSNARSPLDAFESMFSELNESWFFYFAPTWMVGGLGNIPGFMKLFAPKALAENPNFAKLITSSATDLLKEPTGAGKSMLALKAGLILSGVGIATLAEYSLNFYRNILTERVFHKAQFSDILSYSDGKTHEDSPQLKKSYRRVKQCLAGITAFLVGGYALAKTHNSKFLTPIQKFLVNHFDFQIAENAVKKLKFDIHGRQLAVIVGLGGLGYLDAARDRLERLETATRLAMSIPMTAVGNHYMKSYVLSALNKWKPEVMAALTKWEESSWLDNIPLLRSGITKNAQGQMLGIVKARDIAGIAEEMAREQLTKAGKAVTPEALATLTEQLAKPMRTVSNIGLLVPMAMVIGLSWAYLRWVNLSLTPRRYKQMQAKAQFDEQQKLLTQQTPAAVVSLPQAPVVTPAVTTTAIPAYKPVSPLASQQLTLMHIQQIRAQALAQNNQLPVANPWANQQWVPIPVATAVPA